MTRLGPWQTDIGSLAVTLLFADTGVYAGSRVLTNQKERVGVSQSAINQTTEGG